MSDSTTHRGGSDRKRINLREDYEVRYWTAKFNVTREQLEQAVRAVGDHADDVEARLGLQASEVK